MVHSCIVPGCKNRSNKEECKGIKFYTLPFRNEQLLQTWLSLVYRQHNEVTVHSRVCSAHFVGGIKKNTEDLPQIFPWQRSVSKSIHVPNETVEKVVADLTPSQIIEHDHCYFSSHHKVSSRVSTGLGSSYLTLVTASDMLHLYVPTTDVSTLTDPSLQATPLFSIELFIENDDAIQFYTGFESYHILNICFQFLGDAVDHLQYRGSKAKSTVHLESRGAPRVLTPLNEFFLVLCRLRCALMENDLAYRFGISQ